MTQDDRLIINTFSGRLSKERAVDISATDSLPPENAGLIGSLANLFEKFSAETLLHAVPGLTRELYSMALLSPGKNDMLFFIHPQREDAARLAELYRKVLSKTNLNAEFQGYNTARNDDSVFSIEMTIKNALAAILKIATTPVNMWNYRIILNGSGGPEELLPYLSMVWAIFDIPLYYLPPEENKLIQLPSSGTVNFETDLIKSLEGRFSDLVRENLIEEEKFYRGLDPATIKNMEPLLSKFENKVALSPLGFLLWEKFWLENPPPLPHSDRIPLDKDHLGEVDNEIFGSAAFSRFRERLGWNDFVEDFWYVKECNPDEAFIIVGDPDFLIHYCGVVLKARVTATHPRHFQEIKEELGRLLER
ncbi:MAG: hypothetical protein M1269_03055 [Chloroflexi bacterium]|nr:hypothetical protein [Chloroflexota bacterium]